MKLENWCIVTAPISSYTPPELIKTYLSGKVYGHPIFNEGHSITTSRIIEAKDGKVRTKSGSIYELGEVDPNYEKEFPNALHRLINNE